ncbi:hypothetical protein [Nonomuraea bangladeshensis]
MGDGDVVVEVWCGVVERVVEAEFDGDGHVCTVCGAAGHTEAD